MKKIYCYFFIQYFQFVLKFHRGFYTHLLSKLLYFALSFWSFSICYYLLNYSYVFVFIHIYVMGSLFHKTYTVCDFILLITNNIIKWQTKTNIRYIIDIDWFCDLNVYFILYSFLMLYIVWLLIILYLNC